MQSQPKPRSRAKALEHRKRAQYVSAACTACRKSKTRCNGNTPCHNCEKRSIDCRYPSPSNYTLKRAFTIKKQRPGCSSREDTANTEANNGPQTSSVQHQPTIRDRAIWRCYVQNDSLSSSPSETVATTLHFDDHRTKPLFPLSSLPDVCGPSSSSFGFSVASLILQHLTRDSGYFNPHEKASSSYNCASTNQILLSNPGRISQSIKFSLYQSMELEEALRLLRVYYDVFGIMHPFIDMAKLYQQAKVIWTRPPVASPKQSTQSLPNHDTNVIQLAIAVALLSEAGGSHPIADEIFQSMQDSVVRNVLSIDLELERLVLLVLIGVYHWFNDDCRLSSRFFALTARLILEMGIHKKQTFLCRFSLPPEREIASVLVYTTVILDRQMSFAAGLPCALRDVNIDIPKVDRYQYLNAMVSYVDFGFRHWNVVVDTCGEVKDFDDAIFDQLEDEVKSWQMNLPSNLQPENFGISFPTPVPGQSVRRTCATLLMSAVLYFRANQIRILILRPLLFSRESTAAHITRIATAVEVSGDTIRKMVELDRHSDLYRKHHVTLNHFLSSAISVLFLTLAQCGKLQGHGIVNDRSNSFSQDSLMNTVFEAFNLIRSYCSFSPACRRLWESFSVPRSILLKRGLLNQSQSFEEQDYHSGGMGSPSPFNASRGEEPSISNSYASHQSDTPKEIFGMNAIPDSLISNQDDICIADFLLDTGYDPALYFGADFNFT